MAGLVYTLALLLSIALLVCLILFFSKTVSIFYVLAFGSVVVTNLGFLHLACADNLKTALFANQTLYIGGCLVPWFFLMCIADLSKVTIPRIVHAFCGISSTIIFTAVSSIGIYDIYYKNVDFVVKNGFGMLVKEYGPLHAIYPIYLIVTSIMGMCCVYIAIRHKNEVPISTSILLTLSMMLSMVGYFGRRIIGLDYEIIPFIYDITLILILFLLIPISLLNLADVTASSMAESDIYGFLIFDKQGNYLGSDDAAKRWFPQIHKINIGKKLILDDESVDNMIAEMIAMPNTEIMRHIKLGDCYLELVGFFIKRNFRKAVHCIYLRDDTTQQKLNKLNEKYQENLERDVEEKTEKIRNIQNDIVFSMASIVENRDNNTGGHIARTSDVVNIFVKHLKENSDIEELTDVLANNITKAAPLHDFGKIAIPDLILNKPGKFEPEEYEIMKQHSVKGADIVSRILQNSNDEEFRRIAVNVAHYHHERWDGNGYPDRLKGFEIPFEARVMALADVFDALVSKRVYKERMSYEKAFSIIEDSCGSQFDPELGKLFLECRQELQVLYDSYED